MFSPMSRVGRLLSPPSPLSVFFRGYLANFFNRPSRFRGLHGHQMTKQGFFKHGQLRIVIDTPKPSDVKRLRKGSYPVLMKTVGGRKKIMDKILAGDRFIAEY